MPLIGALTVVSAAFSPIEAGIITVGPPETFTSGFTRPPGDVHTFENATDLNGFSATSFDKLVVVFSGENHNGLDPAGVTYGGASMTVAATIDTGNTGSGQHWAYIAYLDNPTADGDLVFDFSDGNGLGGAIFGLNNTAAGVGNTAVNGGGNTVSLTTISPDSLVVAVGTNNSSTNQPNPDSPLQQVGRIDSGSSGHGSGYQQVPSATSVSPTFSGGLITAAVAFEAGGTPPPADTFALTITPATAPDTGFDLAWESQEGKLYNLRTSPDLTGGISTWTLAEGDIEATPPTNTANVDAADPRRFYAVEEFDAPPPPPVFATDFEDDDGGFTVSTPAETAEGSAWEWGAPDSDNGQPSPNDLVLTAGNSGANAWATNLGTADEGFYTNPTTTFLRSPVIDLSAATAAGLTFAEAADFDDGDSAEIFVVSASDDTEIAGPIHSSSTGALRTADWATANGGDPIALPPAALGRSVRLEWRFTGASDAFLGWYIDDVAVTAE